MNQNFDYDNINLIARYSDVDSRSECETTIKLGDFTFKNPVIPANMESVINESLCEKLATEGYFYVMHRFNIDMVAFVKDMKSKKLYSSISIGVNKDSYDLIENLVSEKLKPEFITIDIAHGHCKKMKKMIKFVNEKLPASFIIAGNAATIDATRDIDKWGADAIKIGIGPGSACTTYPTTGFGSRNIQASVVNECASVTRKHIIADGGIKNPADIAKSIVLGASMVMAGGMMSAFLDSPGRIVEIDDIKYKEFYGSASARQGDKKNRVEGTVKLNKLKTMNLTDQLEYLTECLQSAISYGGGRKLIDLQSVRWR